MSFPNFFDLIFRMLRVAVATNAICLMADGMDQAKFKCPRLRGRDNIANSKLFQSLFGLGSMLPEFGSTDSS